jgi:hypothetical protein
MTIQVPEEGPVDENLVNKNLVERKEVNPVIEINKIIKNEQ